LVMILDEEPTPADERKELAIKPKGMGCYHSGRSDVSQNAQIFLRKHNPDK